MKRAAALILCLCLMLPALAMAQSLEDMLKKGEDFMARGDLNSAAICYDIAMKMDPANLAVLTGLAQLKARQGDVEGALKLVDDALVKEPANGQLYLAKASILEAAGRTDEAELAKQYALICGAEVPAAPAAAPEPQGSVSFVVNAVISTPEPQGGVTFVVNDPAPQQGVSFVVNDPAPQQGVTFTVNAAPQKDPKLTAAMTDKNAGINAAPENLAGLTGSCSAAFFLANQGNVPDGLTPNKSADGLRVHLGVLSESDVNGYYPVAVSPSGKVKIYNGSGGMLFAVRDGEVIGMTPNYAKGAQDNKNQQYTLKPYTKYGTMAERDSFAFSPDERYFALTFPTQVLQQMRYYDLIIGDTLTGDLYLAEATPTKATQSGATAAITAAFDPEGKYIYYLAYGRDIGEGPCALKRYEMATGKVEMLYSQQGLWMNQPRLVVSADGTVRTVSDQQKQDLKAAALTFREVNGQWTCEERQAALPVRSQRLERYLYSEKSGHELILCRAMMSVSEAQTVPVYYLTLNGEAIMLENGATHAEKVPLTEELFNPKTYRYMNIVSAEISPDGHFALISAGSVGGFGNTPVLIDLETLEYKNLFRPTSLMRGNTALNTFTWNGDGSLLLYFKGSNALYTLK